MDQFAPEIAESGWCLGQVSSPPLRVFSAALSPDQLSRRYVVQSDELQL